MALTKDNILHKLKYAKINSALIRKILSYYYRENKIYKIPFGPLRGMKMRYHKSINFHAMLGLWELDSFQALSQLLIKGKLLKNKMVICDVGANIGTYSLWFSRLISSKGTVYAFEPSPGVIDMLEENILLNKAANVKVAKLACANKVGSTDFFIGCHHHASSLLADWAGEGGIAPERIKCNTTTLDYFFYGEEKKEGPDLVKMDIEGGALFALQGCDKCIRDKHPIFIIESHLPEEDLAISRLLVQHNYQAYRINDHKWVELLEETFPNPRGVWGKLLICPNELRSYLSKVLLK